MGTRAEALRAPGNGQRSEWWYALGALLLIAAMTVALAVLSSNRQAVAPDAVHPAQPVTAPAHAAPVGGDGVRVGGTSIYRYHPLP